MLAMDLLFIAFIMFSYVSCIPDLSKTFLMKGCWILSKAFAASGEVIMFVFFFQFLYLVDYTDNFDMFLGYVFKSSTEYFLHLCS